MAAAKATHLDHENPWPGLEPFTELDVAYFHGRDTETSELFRLVRREAVTVLFGGSGLGKTSLLQAGLFPVLRSNGFVPVYVRIDFSGQGPAPRTQLLDALLAECREGGVEAPPPAGSETLWEYFHRVDTEFWNERNRPVTPVIALDQFEEVFTQGQANEQARHRAREFLVELGDLIENRVPGHLKSGLDENPELASRFDFRKTDFKLSLSFREDYLAHIEGLKRQIPSLTYNRLRLTPMNGEQANAVVAESGGHLVDQPVTAVIIGLAAGRGTLAAPPQPPEYAELEIDPALLSVICSELNGRRQRRGDARITADLISGAEHEILSDFYERSVRERDPRLRAFVEDELLTDRGYRDSYALEDALSLPGITQTDMDALVAGRLLRVDDRFGVRRLELTHDVLTRVVRESRDSRQARELARRQRRNLVFSSVLAAGAAAVLAGGVYVYELRNRADDLLRRAQATQLVTQSERFQDTRYDLSLLLNVEAARRAPTLDVRAGFVSRLVSHPHVAGFLAGDAALLSVAFDPQARFVAAASDDNAIRRWDLASRTALAPLVGHRDSVLTVAVAPGGELLASGGADASVMLWDARSGQSLALLEGHRERVLSVAFGPSGETLASASYDGTVRLWDVAQRAPLATLSGHRGRVLAVAFSPDGTRLASAGDDETVILWDLATGEPHMRLPLEQERALGHRDRVLGIAFSPDGRTLASAGGDRRVKLWDTGSGRLTETLEGHGGAVLSVAFGPDGRHIATAGDDRTVRLWDLTAPQATLTLSGHGDSVTGVAFRPDGKGLVSTGDDGNLILWDTSRRIGFRTLRGHADQVQAVVFASDGKRVASAGDDAAVLLWESATGAPIRRLEGHERRVRSLAFDPRGGQLASAGDDKTVILWDLQRGVPGARLEADGAVLGVAYAPNGALLASAGRDKAVTLWDTGSGQRLGALEVSDWVWAVRFSPEGKLIAAAQNDNTVSLWDAQTRTRLAILSGHDKAVRDVAFSPDGTLLGSASDDGTVVLWQLDTRRRRAVLTGHRAPVLALAFGPEGATLASASRDDSVILWDVAVGKPLVTIAVHRKAVTGVAFSPDGETVASASQDQTLLLWEWGADSLAAEACRVANRNLSCSEWRQYMGSTPYRKTCEAAAASADCD